METILVTTDFSKPANGAVEYAAHLARFFDTKLVIVHAFNLPLGGYDMAATLETIAGLRREAMDKLKVIKDHLTSNGYDPGIEIYADPGPVYTVINDAANTCGAELVVMGMTGEAGKIKQHLIGSATLNTARELSLPLLIIPESVSYKPVKNICLAAVIDGLEKSTLLYSARAVAKLFGAELEIVTVEPADKEQKAHSPEAYSFIEKRLQDTKHKQVFLHEDNEALALEYYFKFHETDMVIVNPRKHSLFGSLFARSVTKHLSFHCRVPLLILH